MTQRPSRANQGTPHPRRKGEREKTQFAGDWKIEHGSRW